MRENFVRQNISVSLRHNQVTELVSLCFLVMLKRVLNYEYTIPTLLGTLKVALHVKEPGTL